MESTLAYESFYSCDYVLDTCCKLAYQSDSWAGVWATLVCVQWYLGGVSQTWYQSSQADCRLPLAGVIAFLLGRKPRWISAIFAKSARLLLTKRQCHRISLSSMPRLSWHSSP